MDTLDLHRALFAIIHDVRPSLIEVGSPMREEIAQALCEKSIWRAEIGPIDALSARWLETKTDWYNNHFARYRATQLFFCEKDSFRRSARSMFDTDIFDMEKPFSENSERDFLAIIAPIVRSQWQNDFFVLHVEERDRLHGMFKAVPNTSSDLELYEWFTKELDQ